MERQSGTTIVDRLAYACHHCRTALILRERDTWRGWRRCPACERPILPPDVSERAPAPWEARSNRNYLPTESPNAEYRRHDDLLVFRAVHPRKPSLLRGVMLLGLALAVVGVIYGTLENNQFTISLSGLFALVLTLALVRPARRS